MSLFDNADLFEAPELFGSTDLFPFLPPDIADLSLWLDASTLALTDGAAVSEWRDRSTNGYHVTQATSTAQPTFRADAKNGLPAVDFDGGDSLARTTAMITNATDGTSTAFAVVKPDVVSAGTRLIVNNDGGSGTTRGPQILRQDAANVTIVSNRSAVTDSAGAAMVAGNWHTIETIQNTTSVEALLDGTGNGATAVTLNNVTAQVLRVGTYAGSLNFDGMMGEIVIYARALSADERNQVRAYLTAKWGL